MPSSTVLLCTLISPILLAFFFQAEDGIRDGHVTGVQTCALPICALPLEALLPGEHGRLPLPPHADPVRRVTTVRRAARPRVDRKSGVEGRRGERGGRVRDESNETATDTVTVETSRTYAGRSDARR